MLVQTQAQGDGLVWITAYRCVIDAPQEKSTPRDNFYSLMRREPGDPRNGKYGYTHSITYLVPNTRIKLILLCGHQRARDCIEVNTQGTSIPIDLIKSISSFTVPTAITVTHCINYFSFEKLEQIITKAIQASQGSKAYKHDIVVSDKKEHVFMKGTSRIALLEDDVSTKLIITSNPEERKRPMLKQDPIRGTWASEYWTRSLFDALYGYDPLPHNFAGLYLFQPAKINRRTGQVA